jgi:hypothetical protein
LKDLDKPLLIEEKGLVKPSKIRLIIINEDKTGKEFYRKYPKSYYFVVKKKVYFFVSKAVLNLNFPTVIYCYNNPFPVFIDYKITELDGKTVRSQAQFDALDDKEKMLASNFVIDGRTVQAAFDSDWMVGLFEKPSFNAKVLLIILAAVVLAVLIVLQLMCKIDVLGQCKKHAFFFIPFWKFKRWKK